MGNLEGIRRKSTDIRVREATLYFLPAPMRMPLKFGAQVVEGVTCARVCVRVEDTRGRGAVGWGETPLAVAWVWPSALPWDERERRLRDFCQRLAREIPAFDGGGHPMEISHDFQQSRLGGLLAEANAAHAGTIMGVESNAMQFYPAVSAPEARVHPGLYARRGGVLDLTTLTGPGFGYRTDAIGRALPAPEAPWSPPPRG